MADAPLVTAPSRRFEEAPNFLWFLQRGQIGRRGVLASMRALLALVSLVFVSGCLSAPADPLQSTAESSSAGFAAVLQPNDVGADTFEVTMTDAPQEFLISHPEEGPITVTLTVLRGVYEGLRLQGPDGPCFDADMGGGQIIPGSAPAVVRVDCGKVPFGHHMLRVSVGVGMAGGRISVTGAEILLAGEGA